MMAEEKQMTVQQKFDTIYMLSNTGSTGAWKIADEKAIAMLCIELQLTRVICEREKLMKSDKCTPLADAYMCAEYNKFTWKLKEATQEAEDAAVVAEKTPVEAQITLGEITITPVEAVEA